MCTEQLYSRQYRNRRREDVFAKQKKNTVDFLFIINFNFVKMPFRNQSRQAYRDEWSVQHYSYILIL